LGAAVRSGGVVSPVLLRERQRHPVLQLHAHRFLEARRTARRKGFRRTQSLLSQIKTTIMADVLQLKYIVASIVYSLIGIIILVVSFMIIEKITPENTWKEIVQGRNMAIAIIFAAYIIAIAIIISSAIHG
jgi:putative membrane protein